MPLVSCRRFSICSRVRFPVTNVATGSFCLVVNWYKSGSYYLHDLSMKVLCTCCYETIYMKILTRQASFTFLQLSRRRRRLTVSPMDVSLCRVLICRLDLTNHLELNCYLLLFLIYTSNLWCWTFYYSLFWICFVWLQIVTV